MRLWKLIAILTLVISFGAVSGCSFLSLPDKAVYIAPGQIAELAERDTYRVWITNKKTQEKELRVLDTRKHTGTMWIGRPQNGE